MVCQKDRHAVVKLEGVRGGRGRSRGRSRGRGRGGRETNEFAMAGSTVVVVAATLTECKVVFVGARV